jgi:nickel-dependent lactate racemase
MSRRINLFLYSSLSEETTKKVFCTKVRSWEECLEKLQSLHGEDFEALLIPQGGILLPRISVKD